MRYVKKFGCHYNQSGVLKIEILILLRLAKFQNLGTPPNRWPCIQDTLSSRATLGLWSSALREQRHFAYNSWPYGQIKTLTLYSDPKSGVQASLKYNTSNNTT